MQLIENKTLKNILTIFFGTALAQVISFAFSPVLSRIYTPNEFAVLGIAMAIINPISVIVCARYDLAILLPNSFKKSANLIFLSSILSIVISCVLFILYYILQHFSSLFSGYVITFNIACLIFTTCVFIGINQSLNYWIIKKEAFKKNATNKVIQTLSITFFSLVFGLLAINNGLLIGYSLGWLAYLVVTFYQVKKLDFTFKLFDSKEIKVVAKEFSNFPKYNLLPAFLNAFSSSIPVYYFSLFFNLTENGYFNFCRQFLVAPVSLVTVAVSQVYFAEIVKKKNAGQSIKNDVYLVLKRLGILAIAMLVVLGIWGDYLYSLVFGGQWLASGKMASVLVFSIALQLIVSPLSVLLPALGRVKLLSIWQFIFFISMLCLGLFSFKDYNNFILIEVVIEVLNYGLYLAIILFALKNYEEKLRLKV